MRNSYILTSTILLLLSGGTAAHADKLDDFKEAAANSGCNSIPYTDLRRNCRSQQSEVHPWCDGGRGPVSCATGVTAQLRVDLTREQRRLDDQLQRRRELEDKRARAADDIERTRYDAELHQLDNEIATTKRRVDEVQREIGTRKDLVDKTIYTLQKCLDYRRAVTNVFAYTTDKVHGESAAELKPYAEQLRAKWAAEISGHADAINNKTNALTHCNTERP